MSQRFSIRRVENLEAFAIDDRLNHACHARLSIVSTVRFDIPDEVLAALGVDVATGSGELRFAAAVKLYELGRLSSGAAAQLAGVPRVVFSRNSANSVRPPLARTRPRLPEISNAPDLTRQGDSLQLRCRLRRIGEGLA